MFNINGNLYKLYLEDGDITVLQNVCTGQTISIPTSQVWQYYE